MPVNPDERSELREHSNLPCLAVPEALVPTMERAGLRVWRQKEAEQMVKDGLAKDISEAQGKIFDDVDRGTGEAQ